MSRSMLAIVPITLLLALPALAQPAEGEAMATAVAAAPPPGAAYAADRRADHWRMQLGAGAGYAEPWQGSGGAAAAAQILATSPSGRFRFGVEGLYQGFSTNIFGVKHVDIDSYLVNLVFHYVAFPKALLTPYIGAGIGLQINEISEHDVESGSALALRDRVGVGYDFTGIAGLELPIGRFLALYVEGRLTAAYQITGEDEDDNEAYADYYYRGVDKVRAEDTGSAAAIGGVRLRF